MVDPLEIAGLSTPWYVAATLFLSYMIWGFFFNNGSLNIDYKGKSALHLYKILKISVIIGSGLLSITMLSGYILATLQDRGNLWSEFLSLSQITNAVGVLALVTVLAVGNGYLVSKPKQRVFEGESILSVSLGSSWFITALFAGLYFFISTADISSLEDPLLSIFILLGFFSALLVLVRWENLSQMKLKKLLILLFFTVALPFVIGYLLVSSFTYTAAETSHRTENYRLELLPGGSGKWGITGSEEFVASTYNVHMSRVSGLFPYVVIDYKDYNFTIDNDGLPNIKVYAMQEKNGNGQEINFGASATNSALGIENVSIDMNNKKIIIELDERKFRQSGVRQFEIKGRIPVDPAQIDVPLSSSLGCQGTCVSLELRNNMNSTIKIIEFTQTFTAQQQNRNCSIGEMTAQRLFGDDVLRVEFENGIYQMIGGTIWRPYGLTAELLNTDQVPRLQFTNVKIPPQTGVKLEIVLFCNPI